MKSSGPVIWAEHGWVKFAAPYAQGVTQEFAKELKERIPVKLRQWSKMERVWLVDPSALDELVRIARRHFPGLHVANGSRNDTSGDRQRPVVSVDDAFSTFASLLRKASVGCQAKVYRALAADLHPDHGGDLEVMRRLNVAWDCIKQGAKN